MKISIPVSGNQLLKRIYIAKLEIGIFCYGVIKPSVSTELIESIMDYLLAEIQVNFIVKNRCQCTWCEWFAA